MQIRLVERDHARRLRGGRVRLGRADVAKDGRVDRPRETLAAGIRETGVRPDPIIVHGLSRIKLMRSPPISIVVVVIVMPSENEGGGGRERATHDERVPLRSEDLDKVDREWLRRLPVRLDNRHVVPVDGKVIVWLACDVEHAEPVSLVEGRKEVGK